ncbi:uncharacterized protein LOC141855906 [Brevipalpus obovatus]|uniref:uncharacterized protein LOC141855906 n=1 Tax=Brevipalpus obovatus TaxID=246614 RepID=UPI003D9DF623
MAPGRSKLGQIMRRDEKIKILEEKRDIAMKSIGLLSRKLFKTGAIIEKDFTLLKDEALDVFFKNHDAFSDGIQEIIDIVSNFDQNVVEKVSKSFATDLNQENSDAEIDDLAQRLQVGSLGESGEDSGTESRNANGIDKFNGNAGMEVDCVDCPSLSNSLHMNSSICSSLSSEKSRVEDNFHDLIADPMKTKIEIPKIPKAKEMSVRISWVIDPSNFCVNPYGGGPAFVLNMQKEQKMLIEKGITGYAEIMPGMLCAALYTDMYWHRAKIVSVNQSPTNPGTIESVKVFFIDFGNYETVITENIMPLAKSLAEQFQYSVNCHLFGVESESEWPEACTEVLKSYYMLQSDIKAIFSPPQPRQTEFGQIMVYPIKLLGIKNGGTENISDEILSELAKASLKENGAKKAKKSK